MLQESNTISMRLAYGQALMELGGKYPEVVVLSADVANSDHSYMFQQAFPERFFNVGIAEQGLVDVAVGLAHSGKIPFANTFAFLFATRALEMVRTHLCYGKANVKLAGAYGGLSDSFDGPTHHSISDVAIMRSLPNMCVIVPAEPTALVDFLTQVADWQGPVFLRLNRNPVPSVFANGYHPHIGKAVTVRSGSDITLVCNGILVSRCMSAADELTRKGVSVRILEMHTVKPLDTDAILLAAQETGAVVTAEEHSIVGGLGAAVTETLSELCPVPVKRVGLPDVFAETGPYHDLLDRYGMSVDNIIRAAEDAMMMKR